jgi:hypothetical protein
VREVVREFGPLDVGQDAKKGTAEMNEESLTTLLAPKPVMTSIAAMGVLLPLDFAIIASNR